MKLNILKKESIVGDIMDSETLLITIRSLRLFINLNEDLIKGEKLLMYSKVDKMVEMVQHARIRSKMK